MQTQPKQEWFEVDFEVDSTAMVILCASVRKYIKTQLEQKLFDIDFKAGSSAIVF